MQKNHKVHLHNSPIKLSYSVCNFIYCPKKIAHVQLFLTSISGCYHLTHKDLINIFASEVTSVYFGGASYKMQSEFMLTALGKSTIGGIFKNNKKQTKQTTKKSTLTCIIGNLMFKLYIALCFGKKYPHPNPTINNDLRQQLSLCKCISCISEILFNAISKKLQVLVSDSLTTMFYQS